MRRQRRLGVWGWTCALVVLLCSVARPARSQVQPVLETEDGEDSAGPALVWSEHWRPFEGYDWAITGTAVASIIAASAIGPNENDPRRGPILFDGAVRDVLRLPTERARRLTREMSDVMLTMNWGWAFLVDALSVAAWQKNSPEVARELLLINLETLTVTAAIQQITIAFSSRERPYGQVCGGEIEDDTEECREINRYKSFFSGHTSQTFAAAGAMCMHHAYLPLYGGGFVEHLPCVVGFAFAATTGLFRITGDQHYASDVLTGAVIGTGAGLLVPWLLHYGQRPRVQDDEEFGIARQEVPRIRILPGPGGVAAVGTF